MSNELTTTLEISIDVHFENSDFPSIVNISAGFPRDFRYLEQSINNKARNDSSFDRYSSTELSLFFPFHFTIPLECRCSDVVPTFAWHLAELL